MITSLSSFLCCLRKPRRIKSVIWLLLTLILFCIYVNYPLHMFFHSPFDEPLLLSTNGYPSLNPDLYPPTPIKSECYAHVFSTHTAASSFPPAEPTKRIEENSSILLVTASNTYMTLNVILRHLFIPYEICYLNEVPRLNSSPLLDRLGRPDSLPVGLIIFEDFATYTGLPTWQRNTLDDYCRANKIGVIGFLNDGRSFSTEPNSVARVGELPLYLHRLSTHPWGFFLANNVSLFRVTHGGRMQPGWLQFPISSTTCCQATLVPKLGYEKYFVPLAFTKITVESKSTAITTSCVLSTNETTKGIYQSLALEDVGLFDDIHRVLFSTPVNGFWANSMLILDAIAYLGGPHMFTSPLFSSPSNPPTETQISSTSTDFVTADLTRWILVDVDDVFSNLLGVPFQEEDALAMLTAQQRWRQWIPNFTLNLGFCGQHYEYANRLERPGYERLLSYRNHFWWFDHLWSHQQAHQLSRKQLLEYMNLNKLFAHKYGIPVRYSYAVPPYHSGVYPILDDLYISWKQVWNITVTSTQQYPHVSAAGPHLGFRYKNVQVLPRQSCGVYSQSIRLTDIPGGSERLRQSILGGSLFFTVLFNPLSIFMTHLPNYKGDRLALYVFDGLFEFLRDWTNLQLRTAPPTELAQYYSHHFDKWGANEPPVHSDPCRDPHTRALWPIDFPCGSEFLPHLIIVGPQKTGTTALAHFLRLHPAFSSNHYQSNTTFEEMQFFSSDSIYARGIRWYMQQFDRHTDPSIRMIRFEKSATYFDDTKTAFRLRSLIPQAKVIVMLSDPITRAYSWYQHSLAHQDPAPKLISFYNLLRFGRNLTTERLAKLATVDQLKSVRLNVTNITAMERMITRIRDLYNRCMLPGAYAFHLSRWLKYFLPTQILLLDSQVFQTSPAVSLEIVQSFLGLQEHLNYSAYLQYDSKKGFFCLRSGHHFPVWPGTNVHLRPCLGSGKGRNYRKLDPNTEVPKLSRMHFGAANIALYNLLRKQLIWRQWLARAGSEYPDWLLQSLNISGSVPIN